MHSSSVAKSSDALLARSVSPRGAGTSNWRGHDFCHVLTKISRTNGGYFAEIALKPRLRRRPTTCGPHPMDRAVCSQGLDSALAALRRAPSFRSSPLLYSGAPGSGNSRTARAVGELKSSRFIAKQPPCVQSFRSVRPRNAQ